MGKFKEAKPKIAHRRRISSVWIIPIVALLLAGWLVWKNSIAKGPLVTITFETAEGLAAGKTEIRCRSVKIGEVETVNLNSGLNGVEVSVRIEPDAVKLLHQDSQFWVVRPRITAQSVTGVDTLLSGAYIELDPGESKKISYSFKGLEVPPVTSSSVPGLRLTLQSKKAGSLTIGAPVYYLGYEVGRVERQTLNIEKNRIHFNIFIKKEYATLVSKNTHFWHSSGISINAGADGFKLQTSSLKALVAGGVSFGLLKGNTKGPLAHDGDTFELFEDKSAAEAATFTPDYQILLFFDQSVRGLQRGAPVEYRGIAFGRVSDIAFKYASPGDTRVPVLIEVDSKAMSKKFLSDKLDDELLEDLIRRGLQAKLSTASILTGALFVEFEHSKDPAILLANKKLKHVHNIPVVPTVSSGLAQLESKLDNFLNKLDNLKLNETLNKFGQTSDEATQMLADSRKTLELLDKTLKETHSLLANPETKNITKNINKTLTELQKSIESIGPNGTVQGDLRRTLDELRAAIRSFDALSKTINEKPNSLLFGRDSSSKAIPRARKR